MDIIDNIVLWVISFLVAIPIGDVLIHILKIVLGYISKRLLSKIERTWENTSQELKNNIKITVNCIIMFICVSIISVFIEDSIQAKHEQNGNIEKVGSSVETESNTQLEVSVESKNKLEYYINHAENITYDELNELSDEELMKIRNSIYAIHGAIFEGELYDFYCKFEWYKPWRSFEETKKSITKEQWSLIEKIKNIEKQRKIEKK